MPPPTYEQEQDFILNLGRALIDWQNVESAAYRLYVAFMGEANPKLVSVSFHHLQSFNSAITLLDRCAYFALPDGLLRVRWEGEKGKEKNQGLRARLNDQAAVRNRLVHFRFHPGMKDGKPVVSLGPSYFDATYAINEKWKNPAHEIDLKRLKTAQRNFKKLADDIHQFEKDFSSAIAK